MHLLKLPVMLCIMNHCVGGKKKVKIYAGSDHAGLKLKQHVIQILTNQKFQVEDLGTHDEASCDYADYAHAVSKAVIKDNQSFGLLVCGSGIGISIAANRHSGIRAALCTSSLEAKLSRMHNDANILVMGGRIIGTAMAEDIVEVFFKTQFEGGRHLARISKIETDN